MIKRLRIKLIIASMASLFAVLVTIMAVMAAVNYDKITDVADSTLSILMENDGMFPQMEQGFDEKPDRQPPEMDKPKEDDPGMSPELPYESRYFTVVIDEDGEAVSVNTGKIAAVDTQAAIEYARQAWASGDSSGFEENYRYMSGATDEGTRIIFLDCGRNLDTFKSFVFTGLGVSAVGMLAVFTLVFFLSRRIVKPFSENYEKQKRFITDAGHELKTPLTIIEADAEILQMEMGENEWISDIQNQTRRMAELTNSLVLLAKTEEDHNDMKMIEFPISDVADEETSAFRALARTQGKVLDSCIEAGVALCGDEKSLRRLMDILLDNAVKYCGEKGVIRVTLEKQKGFVKFSVFNTAEHISKDETSRLFDRFYRCDRSRNSETGGYGLGLSIAAAITAAHKGRITADTSDEQSLTITVKLPC